MSGLYWRVKILKEGEHLFVGFLLVPELSAFFFSELSVAVSQFSQ